MKYLPNLITAMPKLPIALCIPAEKMRNSRERQPTLPMGNGRVRTSNCRPRVSKKRELTACSRGLLQPGRLVVNFVLTTG